MKAVKNIQLIDFTGGRVWIPADGLQILVRAKFDQFSTVSIAYSLPGSLIN